MGQKESLNAWTDKLVKDLQRQNAAKATSARIKSADVSGSKFNIAPSAESEGNVDPGLGTRIIDVISRPLYAAANTVKEVDKSLEKWSSDRGIKASKLDENGKPFEEGMNPFEAAWRGLSGQDKTTFRDVISESETDTSKIAEPVKFVGGLALDIALDPVNLLVGGATAGIKAVRGGKAAKKALEESRLIRDSKAISETERVRAGQPTDIKTAAEKADATRELRGVDNSTSVIPDPEALRITPLPVENIPTPNEAFDLTPIGQGKLGVQAMKDGLKLLTDPISGKPLYKAGVERAQMLRAEALPAWKASVEARAAAGAKPLLYSSDNTEYALSIPHVLERLPENVANDMVFGSSWGKYMANANLYPSQIGRGMAEALRVDDLGLSLVDRYKQVSDAIKKAKPTGRGTRKVPLRQMLESAKALVDNTPAIREAQYEMAKTLIKKDMQDAATLVQAKIPQVIDDVTAVHTPVSDSMKALTNAGTEILRQGKAIGASDNAASLAAKETATVIAKVAPEADTSAARAAQAIRRERIAGSPDAKISTRQQNHLRVVEKESDDLLGVPVVELGVKADNHLNGMVEHMLHPIRSKMTLGYGYKAFSEDFRATAIERTARNVINYNRRLNELSKIHGRANLETAFSAFKRGEVPVEEAALKAYTEMGNMVNHMFDVKEPWIGALWRTGAGVDQINKALKMKKVNFAFKEGEKGEIVADQWKTWDIKDPMDFLAKMNDALTHLAGKQAFGTSFSHNFGVSAATPRPGYVRMTVKDTDILGSFIDTTKLYPREFAEQMTRLENMLTKPSSFRGTNIIGDMVKEPEGIVAGIVNNLVDPIMQIWKPFMTILRPGHHIRNLFGDIMMGLLDGVFSVGSYRKGLKMMQAGGSIRKQGVEGLREIEGAANVAGGSKMSTVRLRGRNTDLTYDNGYILANKHGLLPAGHAIEDIEHTAKGLDKFQNSLPMRAASRVSEESGGFTRLAHFSNLMERRSFTRKFDTLDDAAAAAAEQVKKFHPDVHGLTPGERKYGRRIVPFYSWIRQALPVVMNTMITKPGRLNYVNKAQYNVAQAMGLNPDSLSDPFPTDKLYPSFVTAHLTGPWFGDTTFNLGSPQEGVLGDMLNGNPLRNAIGMVNPLLKAPVELATGSNLSTGRSIVDTGEYVDAQLPVINQIAGISGYSPTGTISALLNGLPVPDPQRAVARGEKDHFFNSSLVNLLTGLGIQNVDKPSYQRIAQKEISEQ